MEVFPNITASIPEALDFGFCPINELTTKTVTIHNPFPKTPTRISIVNNSPFIISPLSGTIQGRGKLDITISYTPTDANVLVASVIFQVQNEEDKLMKISAIGKFSYITLNKNVFHFGELLIGQNDTKNLIVKNQSVVPTTFVIEEDTEVQASFGVQSPDNSFAFDLMTGIVPAGQSFLIKIKYSPTVVYMLSAKNFIIRTMGGNSQRFTCIGSGIGLQVSLSSRICNFGEVRSGNSTSRIVTLENQSALPCSFTFYVDKRNIFNFKTIEGNIAAKSTARIVVYFTPKETVSYYCRAFCLIKNHMVLYLDLVGTCYDILQRPIPLSQKDIEVFRTHVLMGTINRLIENSPSLLGSTEEVYAVSAEIPMDEPNQIALHKEMMQNLNEKMISISEEFIDFGFCLKDRVSEGRSITIKNKLPFFIYIMWLIPGETQNPLENPQAFSVTPTSVSINPNSSANFQAFFKPYEPGNYFFQGITCQVWIKRPKQPQIDELGRMSTSQTMGSIGAGSNVHLSRFGVMAIPPLNITLPMVGHSFPSNIQPFIPDIKVSPRKHIKFPPCSPGDSMYQSFEIINNADTPCYFRLLSENTGVFKVFPQVGFIQAKKFTLLTIEYHPNSPQNYSSAIKFVLNHSSSQVINIKVSGVCCDPTIFIDNEAKIFYPPLYTGVSSKQKIGILNSSHIPIDYNIEIPDKYRDELTVEPVTGTMYPHEKIFVEFTFNALKQQEYRFNVPIRIKRVIDLAQDANYIGYFNPGSGEHMHNLRQDPLEKLYHITIHGSGGTGMVDMNPKNIDFDTVSVGFSSVRTFTLSNISNCAIFAKLVIIPKDRSLLQDEDSKQVINSSFVFDFKEGVLAANSNQKVNLRFVPNCRSQSEYYIQCFAKQSFPNHDIRETPLNEDSKIELTAHGDFPVITLIDLRAKNISPSHLWRRFNLTNTINAILSPLTALEIKYNNAEISQTLAQEKLNHFEWDFGKLNFVRSAEARKLRLTMQNIGGVTASFRFVFPDDNKLETEPWVDTGETPPEVAFEDHILENKIFEVNPRGGELQCNQKFDVELSYNPVEIGKHSLNVIFQIIHGKPIVLTLKGETLPPKRGYLTLRAPEFEFEPLPIGLGVGVTQPIKIQNIGDNKITYEVDNSALEDFISENYKFPIFEIQNKEGTIDPGEVTYLFCMFKPLESKEYSVTLPINVKERQNVIQTLYLRLKGKGYHPKRENPLPSPTIFDQLPICRSSFLPESSNVGFSVEQIDFGKAKFGEQIHRMVVIYNKSPTLELKYNFKATELICGDELVLDPISGTLGPNSQVPVKLTLNPNRIPTIYEGELECVIEWENSLKLSGRVGSRKSIDNKELSSGSSSFESIFLRIKKSTVFESPYAINVDSTDLELVKTIFKQTIQSIVSEPETYNLLDEFYHEPNALMEQLDNTEPPNLYNLYSLEDVFEEEEEELEPDYSLERLYLKDEFIDLSRFILESTVFNAISEAIYQESDLMNSGKNYINMKPT